MRPRDAADAARAVQMLLCKEAGAEVHRGASAILASLGIDPYTALAEAREAAAASCSGAPGPLRKDAGPVGAVSVRAAMDGGGTLSLEMSPREANALVCGVFDALGGRRV